MIYVENQERKISCQNCSNYECVNKTNGRVRIGITEDHEIFVVTDDAIQTPHFHVWDRTQLCDLQVCFAMESATLKPHGGAERMLDEERLDRVSTFLLAPCGNNRFQTNWEYALCMWNDNNPQTPVDEQSPMPDYRDHV